MTNWFPGHMNRGISYLYILHCISCKINNTFHICTFWLSILNGLAGMKQMEATLKSVDCVIQVHDARIPITGRNPKLAQSFLAPKPYILVLNKVDLIPAEDQSMIRTALKNAENIDNIIFTNAKKDTCPGLRTVCCKIYLYHFVMFHYLSIVWSIR